MLESHGRSPELIPLPPPLVQVYPYPTQPEATLDAAALTRGGAFTARAERTQQGGTDAGRAARAAERDASQAVRVEVAPERACPMAGGVVLRGGYGERVREREARESANVIARRANLARVQDARRGAQGRSGGRAAADAHTRGGGRGLWHVRHEQTVRTT